MRARSGSEAWLGSFSDDGHLETRTKSLAQTVLLESTKHDKRDSGGDSERGRAKSYILNLQLEDVV